MIMLLGIPFSNVRHIDPRLIVSSCLVSSILVVAFMSPPMAVKAKAAEKPKELQTTRTSGPASSKGAAMNTSSAVAKKFSSSAVAKKKGRGATHEVSCSGSSSGSSYDSSDKSEEENVLKSPEYDAFDDGRTKQLKAEDCAAADATEKPRPKVRLRSRSRGQTSRSSAVAAHRQDPANGANYRKF